MILGFKGKASVLGMLVLLCTVCAQAFQQQPADSLRSITAFTLSASKRTSGLLGAYQVKDRYYFQLADSLLGRELLWVCRISRGPAGEAKILSGDEQANMVVSFERNSGERIFLRKHFYATYRGDSTSSLFGAVSRSSVMPIIAAFKVVARERGSVLIDVTDFLLGDNEGVSLNAAVKAAGTANAGLITSQQADKTYLASFQGYPTNLELVMVRTFLRSKSIRTPTGTGGAVTSETITVELNTSIVQLPHRPMQQRFADARIGYFQVNQLDFDGNGVGVQSRSFIKRWRLEPHPKDQQKYDRGELVEPVKPIVFYIDPATPGRWVPYLMQGIEDWKIAFQHAGFKEAIQAKRAPTKEQDPDWSLFDARHSALVYKPSAVENAEGPSIVDPRSGEILESHINWYHNVMSLVQRMYMVQAAVNDPKARTMKFDEELMGQLIRFVCSHEIGHALGLAHNMGSSSTVPTDSLRNKKWVEANGFCPSIMDYARFNYVAQPEDGIAQSGLMPRIGPYDFWVIEWGYKRYAGYPTAESETGFLNQLLINRTKDKRLWYSAQGSGDPRSMSEDLGDDVLKSNGYGIANLKRLMPKLIEWTKLPNEGYDNLANLHKMVQLQYVRYIRQGSQLIGGIYEDLKSVEEPGSVYRPVEKIRQQAAMEFLNTHFFNTPVWLLDTAVLNRTGQAAAGMISGIQEEIISSLIFPPVRLLAIESRNVALYGKQTYGVKELFEGLRKNIWRELAGPQNIDLYRRSLQRTYLVYVKMTARLSKVLAAGTITSAGKLDYVSSQEVAPIIYHHLRELQSAIKKKLMRPMDSASRYHLQFMLDQIQEVWLEKDSK